MPRSDESDAPVSPPPPPLRPFLVMAQDPSIRNPDGTILMAEIRIPSEELAAGPRGHRVHVVDYDGSREAYFGRHVLPDREPAAWRRADPSLISDRVFHAQNVYALVMRTLFRFEHALGRRVTWQFESHQINVAPHAFLDANAFYSRDDQGLLFGYFAGSKGQPVFACLSHDVVVHEATHALLDGLRKRYLDPSSPDQAAFHEGFADVVALLSVLSLRELLERLLVRGEPRQRQARRRPTTLSRSLVSEESLKRSTLFGLAEEMGAEMRQARGDALRRSVELAPDRRLLATEEFQQPHRRGEVLVAAVMRAFLGVWLNRIGQLGEVEPGRVSLRRVAEEGAEAADYLGTMLVRGLDYMPPVDVSFGDALSAVLTADSEIRPDDWKYNFRVHLRRACLGYGIVPSSSRPDLPGGWKHPEVASDYTRVHHAQLQSDPEEVFRFLWENRHALAVREEPFTRVQSVRPAIRVGPDGFTLRETVAEYTQTLKLAASELPRLRIRVPEGMPPDTEVSLYGGGTLIFDDFGRLKYHVSNDILNREKQSERLCHLWEYGFFRKGGSAFNRFSTLHRLRGLGTLRQAREEW